MDFFTPFRAFVLSLQGVNVVYSKLDEPPLSLSGFLLFLYKGWAFSSLKSTSPFLTCLDFGVCRAIRLVRFGYNTFTGCVA